jgi:hypothetical protein
MVLADLCGNVAAEKKRDEMEEVNGMGSNAVSFSRAALFLWNALRYKVWVRKS